MSRHSGFTLIELLVVIAIIGILSSVVLASLNEARNKGANAAIKSNLSGIRTAAELYYDEKGNYGSMGGVICPTSAVVPPTHVFVIQSVVDAIQASKDAAGVSSANCVVTTSNTTYGGPQWVVSIPLKKTEGTNKSHWCVDSQGSSRWRGGLVTSATGALCNS